MSFANRTAQALLNSLFGKTSSFGALATPPTIHVALSSTDPGEDGTNVTEPAGNGYARKATTAADWNAATLADPSVITNASALAFPQATGGNWLAGTNIGYFALYDAPTGGNYIGKGTLDVAKPVLQGDTPSFAPGALSCSLD